MLQAFPPNTKDVWPFPEYVGACGRMVVETYAGPMLDTVYNQGWEVRVRHDEDQCGVDFVDIEMYSWGSGWWYVSIDLGNDLVPGGTKPLSESMLTKIYGVIIMYFKMITEFLHCVSLN